MLSCLQIENVAVIQKAEVHFQPGLNVLTGETGAGKSILIDSINAILGNRTSKDLVLSFSWQDAAFWFALHPLRGTQGSGTALCADENKNGTLSLTT